MKLPRNVSAGAAARRSMLADFLIGLIIALVALQMAAGVGVVGFFATLVLLILLLWIVIEAAIRRLRHRHSKAPLTRRRRRRPV